MILLDANSTALQSATDLAEVVRLLKGNADRLGQDDTVDAMLQFASAHDDALHRSCLSGHFTGSAAVIDAAAERVLVLFHRKAQRWLQPGGHADGDANLAGVAWREATEETGIHGLRVSADPIDVDIHEVRFPDADPHLHLDVRFLVVAPPGALLNGNHESEALRWVTVDELDRLDADASLKRVARRGLAAARSL